MSAVKKARTGELDKLAPDPKREAFEGWLRSRGAWWAEDLVAIRSPDHKYSEHDRVPLAVRGGWGLMSRGTKIKKGTVLCRIPKGACMEGALGFEAPASEEKDSQVHLAMRLLIEWDKGDASEFSAKLATLPRTEGVCWAWGEEERGWLQGTELQEITARKRTRLEAEWRANALPLNPKWDFGAYIDAAAAAISHANPWFGVCMVSFVDMGNWSEKPDVEFDLEGKEVVGTALRGIAAHSEISQSYGDTGAADLLYRYGFTRRGPGALAGCEDDAVSLSVGALLLAAGGIGDAAARTKLLEDCSVVSPSPWDGMEDVLTVQLSPQPDGSITGLSELRVAMALLTIPDATTGTSTDMTTDTTWRSFAEAQAAAAGQLRAMGVKGDDAMMAGLCVALQTRGSASAQEFSAAVEGAGEELRRAGFAGGAGGAGGGVEGEAEVKEGSKGAEEEEGGSDEEEEEEEELDWPRLAEMCGGGKDGAGLPWLTTHEVTAAAIQALQARCERLRAGLRPPPEEGKGGGGGGGGGGLL